MTPGRLAQLADFAELARRLAPERCWRDPASGETCAWYHAFWPYLRLLDYGSSPAIHKDFYIDGLSRLAKRAQPARILVSGAADFAMLEVVLESFDGAPATPLITVVDRCETPLELCRWYASQAQQQIETTATDILDYRDAGGFDAIVTHSFLGSFAPNDRPKLLDRWYDLLRPGGIVMTINRLRDQEAGTSVSFSANQSEAFIKRLRGDLSGLVEHLDCSAEQIVAMGETYLRRKRSFPVCQKEELVALFQDAGFQLEQLEALKTGDPGASRPEGPTMPGGASYMKIIAQRGETSR